MFQNNTLKFELFQIYLLLSAITGFWLMIKNSYLNRIYLLMLSKKFQKNKENFICEKCGYKNSGNGYTNHCQNCLWSKHVDINPGDRAEECCGIMQPIGLVKEGGVFFIIHKCQKCGIKKRNRAQIDDNFNELIKISVINN